MKKGEKTKQKLFTAAATLFQQNDFRDVTVDRIVEEAGVAKGTFYIYFESKDALIAAYISEYVQKVDMDYQAVLESFSPDTTSSQILLGLINKITDTLMQMIGYSGMSTIYQLLLTDAIDMNAIKGYDRGLYQVFKNILKRGIERKEFNSSLSLDELTKNLVIAIRGLCYEWCIRYPDFDLKARAFSYFQMLLDGIQA